MTTNNDQDPAPIIECRICHSKTTRDLILSPCLCKGSMAYVHYLCLERWLNYSSRETCELCSDRFNVVVQRRYSCFQSVRIWTRHPANRTFILCDLVIGIALTLLTLSLVVICLIGISKFSQDEESMYDENFWRQGIVDVVLLVLLAGYFATMYSMARDHIRPWYTWWTHCKNVKLVLDKNSTQAIANTDTLLCATRSETSTNNSKLKSVANAVTPLTLKSYKVPNCCEKELEVAIVKTDNLHENSTALNRKGPEQIIFIHMPSTSQDTTDHHKDDFKCSTQKCTNYSIN